MTDLLKNQYLVAPVNVIFTGDITFFDGKRQALIVVDLATRRIPAHRLKETAFTSFEVVQLLKGIKESNEIKHSTIFHFDNQSIFGSREIQGFAKKENITFSYADPYTMRNQVSERLNRTLKTKLRALILSSLNIVDKPWLKKKSLKELIQKITWTQLCSFFDQSVADYNNNSHRGDRMFLSSPNLMDKALKSVQVPLIEPSVILAPNDNSSEAIEIAEYKGLVLEQFAGNWETFFKKWKQEQTAQYQELFSQNQNLLKQNKDLQQKIEELIKSNREREKREEEERLLKEIENIRKNKRKNRTIQKKRAYISFNEFSRIQEVTKNSFKDPLVQARVLVALTILYLTGLRISNLLLLTKAQIYELLNTGEIEMRLIKKGKERHLICLAATGRNILREIDSYIDILCGQQSDVGGPLFCSVSDKTKPVHRTNFDKQCNQVLQKVSSEFGKHIRTHSFRATLVTDLLENGIPIEKTRDILGHQSINTTDMYRRTQIGVKELRRTLAAVHKSRAKNWKKDDLIDINYDEFEEEIN